MKYLNIKEYTKNEFVEMFKDVFEHSPEFAEGIFEDGFDKEQYSAEELHSKFCEMLDNTNEDCKLELIQKHPSLAGKLAGQGKLSTNSTQEQQNAGLNTMSEENILEFNELNQKYDDKFKFPFIIAVNELNADNILKEFRKRINHKENTEIIIAIKQVKLIALYRIINILK